jgi:hypothetical protein
MKLPLKTATSKVAAAKGKDQTSQEEEHYGVDKLTSRAPSTTPSHF